MDYLEIIPFDDALKLESIKEELTETLDKTQMFRTRTEMEISVLNDTKFPTASSKYWQAMREQNVHFTELVRLSYEYKRNEIKEIRLKNQIRALEKELDEDKVLDRKLLEIDFEELRFTMMLQSKAARERVREVLSWSDIKAREAAKMSVEELSNVDNHQLISYTQRWIKQSIIMGGGGSPPERQNLLGQLRAGIITCIRMGVLSEVLKDFSEDVKLKIAEEYNGIIKNESPSKRPQIK